MKLLLSNKEIEKVLLTIFSDGGISELYQSGIVMEVDNDHYEQTRKKGNCYEDNLILYLKKEGVLKFVDEEGGGDEFEHLTLKSAQEKLKKIEDKNVIRQVRGEPKIILLPKWVNIDGVYGRKNNIKVISINKDKGRIPKK